MITPVVMGKSEYSDTTNCMELDEVDGVDEVDGIKKPPPTPEKQRTRRRDYYGLIFLSVLFFVTTITVTVVMLSREFRCYRQIENISHMLQRDYPGYFRTEEEQRKHTEEVMRPQGAEMYPVNQTVNSSRSCFVQCAYGYSRKQIPELPQAQELSSDASVYHGCCVSNHHFISPATVTDNSGETRTLVQTLKLRQFFKVDNCSQAVGCTGCQCMQSLEVLTAVVLKIEVEPESEPEQEDRKFEVAWVKMLGCCKCKNT